MNSNRWKWRKAATWKHIYMFYLFFFWRIHACVCTQLGPTLFDPMDYSLPGSSVHEISQARILEWVAIFSYRGSSWPRDRNCIFCTDSLPLSHKDESHRSQKSLPSGRSSWTIGTGWSPSLLLQCLCPPTPPPEHQAPTGLMAAAAAAKSLQSCPTLCDPRDGSPPGSPIPGILQARILEWVAISFSNAWKWKVKVKSHSCVRLLATPWTAAHQAPPSMGFSRQEY